MLCDEWNEMYSFTFQLAYLKPFQFNGVENNLSNIKVNSKNGEKKNEFSMKYVDK